MADESHPPITVTHVSLPVDLINRVLAYLVQRPFIEVSELVVPLKVMADASFASQQKTVTQTIDG